MEITDQELIQKVLAGDSSSFEPLVTKYQPRVFGTVRRYSRRESEVEDLVQDIFIKAFQKLNTFRGEAPFEHWLMRLAVRSCFDYLRGQQRSREKIFSELTDEQEGWLERIDSGADINAQNHALAAKQLLDSVMEKLSPAARMVITMLEIEDKTIKEIADLTGWSIPLVKVRAFRARGELKKLLEKMSKERYL